MKVKALILFVVVGVFSSAYAKNASYEDERARALSLVDSTHFESLESLTEGRFERFKVPNANHTKGASHDLMVRFHAAEGNRLIKIVIDDRMHHYSDVVFAGEVFGGLLAENLGGPRVFRFGKLMHEGHRGYFVEMEELFPGDRRSFTLKGWRFAPTWKSWLGLRPSENQMRQFGEMLAKVLLAGVSISDDWDVIFAQDQVRWIDTARWSLAGRRDWEELVSRGPRPGISYDLENIRTLIAVVGHKDSARGAALLKSFISYLHQQTSGTPHGAGLRQLLRKAFDGQFNFCELNVEPITSRR